MIPPKISNVSGMVKFWALSIVPSLRLRVTNGSTVNGKTASKTPKEPTFSLAPVALVILPPLKLNVAANEKPISTKVLVGESSDKVPPKLVKSPSKDNESSDETMKLP